MRSRNADEYKIGSYVSQVICIAGFAALAGTPITGALINSYDSYTPAIVFSASVIMVSDSGSQTP